MSARSSESVSEGSTLWKRPWRLDQDGYEGLARYASTAPLDLVGLAQHDQTDRLQSQGPAAVIEALFAQLVERQWAYNLAPWHAGQGQLIRDASAIDRGSGTCLDIALLFCAMAKQSHLRPYLAVARHDGEARADHAFVVVDVSARAEGDRGSPLWRGVDLPGLEAHEGDVWARFDAGVPRVPDHWLALDMTEAFRGRSRSQDVTRARQLADEHLNGSTFDFIDLVDIVTAHRIGAEELPAPQDVDRPAIYRRIPRVSGVRRLPSRLRLVEELSERSGVVILLGPPGSGKSVTALQSAIAAAAGAGWVLDASDPGTLRVELAEAAMEDLGQDPSGLDGNEIGAYAGVARERLHASKNRWVVVADNADAEPRTYEGLLPRTQRGQLLLVTSTNADWRAWASTHGAVVHEIPPLELAERREWLNDDSVHVPPDTPLELSLAGRLSRHTALPPTCTLATLVDTAISLLDSPGRRQAVAYAWLPPVAVPPTHVSEALGSPDAASTHTLADVGLVEERDGAWVMHRQVRQAVRELVDDAPASVVVALMTSTRTAAAFQTSSSMRDLDEIHRLVETSELSDGAVARVLFALGTSQERKNTQASASWFEAALERMGASPGSAIEAARRAGALQGIARASLRARSGIQEARTLITEVGSLAAQWPEDHDMKVADSRAEAMIGLLDRQLAAGLKDAKARKRALTDALERIKESARTRAELVDPDSPDIDRSLFNIPGTLLQLAKDEPDQSEVVSLLAQADDLYAKVHETRARRYRTHDSEEVTATVYGQALISYYRAVLLVDLTIDERLELLGNAESLARDSEVVRVGLAAPERLSKNSAKSTALVTKARLVHLQLADILGQVPDGFRYVDVVDDSKTEGAAPLGRLATALIGHGQGGSA